MDVFLGAVLFCLLALLFGEGPGPAGVRPMPVVIVGRVEGPPSGGGALLVAIAIGVGIFVAMLERGG